MDMNLSKLWDIMKDRGAWHAASTWGCKESDMTVTQDELTPLLLREERGGGKAGPPSAVGRLVTSGPCQLLTVASQIPILEMSEKSLGRLNKSKIRKKVSG